MASDDEDGAGSLMGEDSISAATKKPKEDNFFRSKMSFVEQMRAKKREAEERKQSEERKRSEQTASVERADPAVHEKKRRRVSRDNEDEDEDEDDSDGARRYTINM